MVQEKLRVMLGSSVMMIMNIMTAMVMDQMIMQNFKKVMALEV